MPVVQRQQQAAVKVDRRCRRIRIARRLDGPCLQAPRCGYGLWIVDDHLLAILGTGKCPAISVHRDRLAEGNRPHRADGRCGGLVQNLPRQKVIRRDFEQFGARRNRVDHLLLQVDRHKRGWRCQIDFPQDFPVIGMNCGSSVRRRVLSAPQVKYVVTRDLRWADEDIAFVLDPLAEQFVS